MKPKQVLFISGSIGLGHVTRDLAMAAALRKSIPGMEIRWIAASPACQVLQQSGEQLLPESSQWADETSAGAELAARNAARGRFFHFNVFSSFLHDHRLHRRNVSSFREALAARDYDLIISDESYEIVMALREGKVRCHIPFLMIYDFIGVDSMSKNPLELLGTYLINRRWAYGYRRFPEVPITTCFIGEVEDIPNRPFGPGLPNRRDWARERCRILGYVLPFDLMSCQDKAAMRRKLGYGEGPLVICAVGGSGIGQELLDLCCKSFVIAKVRIPNLHMVIVAGPRTQLTESSADAGLEMRGYVPALHEHFAASDLVVTQGGGTTTLELTALRRPFLYFPLEGHFEQQVHVAARLARHNAGIRMNFSGTSPLTLADEITAQIGTEVSCERILTEGAQRLTELANALLQGPARASEAHPQQEGTRPW